MEDDQQVHERDDNNFTVVDKGEIGYDSAPVVTEKTDSSAVSSTSTTTSGTTGEEHEEDRYISPYSDETSDKLVDIDDMCDSNTPNVPDNNVLPDWGPYHNINNSTLAYLQPEPVSTNAETENTLKEFAPATSTTTNTYTDTPIASEPPPSHDTDSNVGDSTCCAWVANLDPRVLDLIYWRDVKKTGMVLGTMLFVLLSLICFTVLSVVSYLGLAVLTITLSFRAYKYLLQAVQKTSDQHPFREYLDLDFGWSRETIDKAVDIIYKHLNCTAHELRRLFLIEDTIDSIKCVLMLWVFTYIGAWFNGMTLFILAVVTVFSLPKVYETYKVPIDKNVDLAYTHVNKVVAQVQERIPFLKKKAKTQ